MAYKYEPTPLMLPTSHYDKRRADHAVNFIQCLKHTTGKWQGQRIMLLPWEEQIVRDIFGIIGEDGFRQFRNAYIEIAKKNGKSTLSSALALYLLYADGEASPEVYSAACDRNHHGGSRFHWPGTVPEAGGERGPVGKMPAADYRGSCHPGESAGISRHA